MSNKSTELSKINFKDKSEKKSWFKKWTIMQVLWTAYHDSGKSSKISVASKKLTEPINITNEDVDIILKSLKRHYGALTNWRIVKNRQLINLNKDKFEAAHKQIGATYKKFEPYHTSSLPGVKLRFYPDTGVVEYKSKTYQFNHGDKTYEILRLLNKDGRNFPLDVSDFINQCNENILRKDRLIRSRQDIRDAIRYLKKDCLKMSKDEYLPIDEHKKGFMLAE